MNNYDFGYLVVIKKYYSWSIETFTNITFTIIFCIYNKSVTFKYIYIYFFKDHEGIWTTGISTVITVTMICSGGSRYETKNSMCGSCEMVIFQPWEKFSPRLYMSPVTEIVHFPVSSYPCHTNTLIQSNYIKI